MDHSQTAMRSARWQWRIVVAMYVVTRFSLLFLIQPVGTDIPYYYERAVRTVDLKQAPYREFKAEYPPLAMWVLAAPAHVDGGTVTLSMIKAGKGLSFLPGYAFMFRFMMLVSDIVAFVLFCGIIRRCAPNRLATCAAVYVAGTAILGNLMYDRLDAVLVMGMMAWAYCWLRTTESDGDSQPLLVWVAFSYVALGFSIAYKLIPVIVLPFLLLAEFRTRAACWQRIGIAAMGILLPIGLSLYPLIELGVGWEVLGFLDYHRARGIEIESTYATVLFVLNQCGMKMTTAQAYGGWNVESGLSMPMAQTSVFLLLLAVATCGLWAFLRGASYSRVVAFYSSCSVIFLAVALSKVLSAQYFMWLLPLSLVMGSMSLKQRQWQMLIGVCLAMMVLSTVVFPYMFFDSFFFQGRKYVNPYPLVELHWLPCLLLVVRNALLVWVTTMLVRATVVATNTQLKRPAVLPSPVATPVSGG